MLLKASAPSETIDVPPTERRTKRERRLPVLPLETLSDSTPEGILTEIRAIELELVVEGENSRILLSEYEALAVIPARYRNDLRHVAVASTGQVDALVSWNFRHIVNVRTRRAVHSVNLRLGYPLIEIVSPEEV